MTTDIEAMVSLLRAAATHRPSWMGERHKHVDVEDTVPDPVDRPDPRPLAANEQPCRVCGEAIVQMPKGQRLSSAWWEHKWGSRGHTAQPEAQL